MKKYYGFIAILLVVSAIAVASDSLARRGLVHDTTAVSDLRSLQGAIDSYYFSQNRLPTSLSQLQLHDGDVAHRLSAYEYRPTSPRGYELCATFQTARSSVGGSYKTQDYANPDGGFAANPEIHQKGHQCFSYQEAAPLRP